MSILFVHYLQIANLLSNGAPCQAFDIAQDDDSALVCKVKGLRMHNLADDRHGSSGASNHQILPCAFEVKWQ